MRKLALFALGVVVGGSVARRSMSTPIGRALLGPRVTSPSNQAPTDRIASWVNSSGQRLVRELLKR